MLTRVANLNIVKYLLISCLASLVDLSVSGYLFSIVNINYLIACNLGIAAGFLFQYFAGMKFVFNNTNTASSFAIYLGTFAVGLLFASGTMWISYKLLMLSFFNSKLLSMLIPFFITYFTRKALLSVKLERKMEYENLL